MMYPFDVRVSELIIKLTELKEKHGDVWVECFAEGCYCGMNVTYLKAEPEKKRGNYVTSDGQEAVILLGERVY